MSQLNVDVITNKTGTGAPSFSNGAVITGVITATTFSGNVTGNVTGTATTAQGLTGTPNVTVGVVTASSVSVSGNVSIAGTLTYEDVTNIDSIGLVTARSGIRINDGGLIVNSGVTTLTTLIPNETRFKSAAEKIVRIDGNTVSIAYTTTAANIGFCTNPSGDITLAVTEIPVDSSFDNHAVSFSIFVNQTGIARSCTAVTLNGVSRTIRWTGGSLASAISGVTTTNGYDIYNFVGINTIGSASTTINYEVLGVVNGGFR